MSDTAVDNTEVSLVLQRYKQRLGIEPDLDDALLKAIFVRDQDPERMELVSRLEWHGDRVTNFAMSRLFFPARGNSPNSLQNHSSYRMVSTR